MRLPTLLFLVVAIAIAIAALTCEAKRTYGVKSLSVTDCIVRDKLDSEIGDDRSGMAITPTRLFHLGDDYMISLDSKNLTGDVLLNITDGIISDMADGALWTLAFDNSTFLNGDDAENGNFNITHLIPLTKTNATVDKSRKVIALSQPLNPFRDSHQPMVFAGVRGFVFASGISDSSPSSGLFHVSLDSGLVTRLFPHDDTTNNTDSGWAWPAFKNDEVEIYDSENWAAWGVMEETKGVITLLATGYNLNGTASIPNRASARSDHKARGGGEVTGIYRWATNGTLLGTVFEGLLSDCAAFTVNYFEKTTSAKRWFLHAEGGSSAIANTTDEWVASCPASHFSLCGNGVFNSGEQCDDGNLVNGDGCNDACDLESTSSSSVLSCFVCNLWPAMFDMGEQQHQHQLSRS